MVYLGVLLKLKSSMLFIFSNLTSIYFYLAIKKGANAPFLLVTCTDLETHSEIYTKSVKVITSAES